jgi:hypothetical protein
MGKSFKKVATIIGIGALGFATAGIGFGLLAGGTLFGATSVLGFTTGLTGSLTLGTIASIGALALSIGSMPGPPVEETGANDRGTAFADADALGCYVFGTTTVQCAVVYEELTGTDPDRLLHDVFAHAWHRIESYEALYIASDEGSELVTFSGNAATGDHADMLWWFRAVGTQVAALSGAPFNDNAWPSTAIFEGVAHSAIVWNIDDDGFKEKFAAVPTKLDVVVEAAWLYDPRLDTGAGGSGSQDFGTPSSWSFNNGNSVLVMLRFLIGEYADGALVWGRGIAEADYDSANFRAMAAVADETVDGIPRSRLGGMFMLNGSFEDFAQRWEAETGGKLSKSGGVYRIWIPHDDLSALTTITDSNLLAGYPVTHSAGGIEGLYNTARGRYIEPTEGYRAIGYPDVAEASAVTEDGGQRILNHDFSWVQDVSIAQRVARIKVRRSRFQRMWRVAIGWSGFGPNYRPFTVHTLNIPETGGDNQLVRVVNRELDAMTGVSILTLQQEDESIYDDTIALGDPHASNTSPSRASPLHGMTSRFIEPVGIGWITDSHGKPAGVRAVQGIADRSQLSLSDNALQIVGTPDATVAYGLPAIPVWDDVEYKLAIMHQSSGSSADGLYLIAYEYSGTTLPNGKTHVGDPSGTSEAVAQQYTTRVDIVADGPMPGATAVRETYTYTPTAGTKFVTFAFANWNAASTVSYWVYWLSLTEVGSRVDLLPGVRAPGDTPDLVPDSATAVYSTFDSAIVDSEINAGTPDVRLFIEQNSSRTYGDPQEISLDTTIVQAITDDFDLAAGFSVTVGLRVDYDSGTDADLLTITSIPAPADGNYVVVITSTFQGSYSIVDIGGGNLETIVGLGNVMLQAVLIKR